MTNFTDIYRALFGKDHILDGNVIDFAEHGRVGGLSTGQGFKFVAPIDGSLPTEGNNPSLILTYDVDGNLETITKTIGTTSYTKTLSYTGSDLTGVSEWVEV